MIKYIGKIAVIKSAAPELFSEGGMVKAASRMLQRAAFELTGLTGTANPR